MEKINQTNEEKKALKAQYNNKKKFVLIIGILINVGILAVVKYLNFFSGSINSVINLFNIAKHIPMVKIVLPLGISYYTLQAVGYLIDVYRGKYEAGGLVKVALFLGYFPQLLEGPIGNYDKLADNLFEGQPFNFKNVLSGSQLILWGVLKKVVIADRLSIVVSAVYGHYADYNGAVIVFAIILFTFQLYAEFSGIIDMVTGVSQIFGINLAKNFDSPFFSKNVSEFWRRWHISLGAWFRDYVFYSVSTAKWFRKMSKVIRKWNKPLLSTILTSAVSLIFVWLLTGLWHGASWKYVVYGLYYYVLMLLGLLIKPLEIKIFKLKDKPAPMWFNFLLIVRTFILVNIGMLIFRAPTLTVAWDIFIHIFGGGQINLIAAKVIDLPDLIMSIVSIALLLSVDYVNYRGISVRESIATKHCVVQMFFWIAVLFIIIIFGAYGNGYIPPDPIYGGF
ncbi:MAG: MBOAT family O-acyltransferase [Clostridia bacterium]